MLEWTGERFLPWIRESTIAYEHLHRYAYAATLVRNKRVLDLACGEGYGSRMLAGEASSVVGIDIDEETVAHATAKYGSATLEYIAGSITKVPIQADHSFDVIVCFEAIEHIDDHETLLREVKRLLKPHGLFVVSTPNKTIYHDESTEENPFHVRELYFEEFEKLLSGHFANVRFLGQRTHPSSSIWPIGPNNTDRFQELVIDRKGTHFEFVPNVERVPLYFIALASDAAGAMPQASSILVDESDGLIKEKNNELRRKDDDLRETKASAAEAIAWREQQIREREGTISSLEESVKWREEQIGQRDARIQSLDEALEWTRGQVSDLEKTSASQQEALAWRAQQVEELQFAKTTLEDANTGLRLDLQNTQRQLIQATGQLESIYASSGWKFILRIRHLRDSIFPAGSFRRRLLEKFMGLLKGGR